MTSKFNLPLMIALAAALSASPAVAQGNSGHGRDRDRGDDRKEQRDERRVRDDDDDDDDDDRPRFERRRTDDRARQRSVSTQRRVPPGWCQGRGNPHNTPQNCRYNSRSSEWERFDTRTNRWEDRAGYERNESRNGTSSYEQAHRDFHYNHDRQCRERAAQRPLDVRWQVQVRSECRAVHDDFHRRWGTPHR
jgi:hypothetical protein